MSRAQPKYPLILERGALFCPAGGFYIDPLRVVDRAIVTHGHSDHCRPGHGKVLATAATLAIARARYGERAFGAAQALAYGERLKIGDATVMLAPAGHVLGSAQVVVEVDGVRAVVSGDYKRTADPTCQPFEAIRCDLFITEATFAIPVFRHPPVEDEIARLLASVQAFPERAHAISVYPLGKCQRLIAELGRSGWGGPIVLHSGLVKLTELYQQLGVTLPEWRAAAAGKWDAAARDSLRGAIVLAPGSALSDKWARRLPDPVMCGASGWMTVRQRAKQSGVELPLIISDHADWDAICATIRETEAEMVWITHGAEEALAHWCQTQGVQAAPLSIAGRSDAEPG
ncbi:MAG: ligase-associated DNA damage response exonuclease [Neomegalonema sp.]|nr:ligase-associated DNA damage response exonuclease [Neomegalonema sp.]